MTLRAQHPAWAICAALFLAAAGRPAAKPNFTGEWKLNVGKSDFRQRPGPLRASLKVSHKDPALHITRTLVTGQGELTTQTVYSTDGKETTNKIPNGREMKNTAKWDGAALLIETPVNAGAGSFTIRWKWTLPDDGRTLTTVRTFAPGEPAQTETYEKQ
jgi:hypothetical protein